LILQWFGFILGLLLFGFVLFNSTHFVFGILTKYRLSFNKTLNISLAVSIIIALGWGEFWGLSPDQSITRYVPAILIMFFYKRNKLFHQKCPLCKEKIKTDAEKCKHCHATLFEIAK